MRYTFQIYNLNMTTYMDTYSPEMKDETLNLSLQPEPSQIEDFNTDSIVRNEVFHLYPKESESMGVPSNYRISNVEGNFKQLGSYVCCERVPRSSTNF